MNLQHALAAGTMVYQISSSWRGNRPNRCDRKELLWPDLEGCQANTLDVPFEFGQK